MIEQAPTLPDAKPPIDSSRTEVDRLPELQIATAAVCRTASGQLLQRKTLPGYFPPPIDERKVVLSQFLVGSQSLVSSQSLVGSGPLAAPPTTVDRRPPAWVMPLRTARLTKRVAAHLPDEEIAPRLTSGTAHLLAPLARHARPSTALTLVCISALVSALAVLAAVIG